MLHLMQFRALCGLHAYVAAPAPNREVPAAPARPPVAHRPGRRPAGVAVPGPAALRLVADQLADRPVREGDHVRVGAGGVDQAAQVGRGVDDALDD